MQVRIYYFSVLVVVFNATAMLASNRVAVIGAGAAGLITGLQLRNAGLKVEIFERNLSLGGLWHYDPKNVDYSNPVYKNLISNLPKQIMSYLNEPFDSKLPSYLTHRDVREYLVNFAKKHNLRENIKMGTEVTRITPNWDLLEDENSEWEVEYTSQNKGEKKCCKKYKYIVVCNGHYDQTSLEKVTGLDCFKGSVIHSKLYDDPDMYANRRVLCIGAKPSGFDIAREVASVASYVHISDRSSQQKSSYNGGLRKNVALHPGINRFLGTNSVLFMDGVTEEIDDVILCTGYEYNFPFLEAIAEKLPLSWSNKCVTPLYKHIFHLKYPSISFIGLPYSVVPFMLFEIQAYFVASVYTGKTLLPDVKYREDSLNFEKAKLLESGLRVRDTHLMGPKQWNYFREIVNSTGPMSERLDKELMTRQRIYEDNHASMPSFPGDDDSFRRREYYDIDLDTCSFKNFEYFPYQSAISHEQAEGRTLWLIRAPKNMDISELNGLQINLPDSVPAGENIDSNNAKFTIKMADPAEHQNMRALFTCRKGDINSTAVGLSVAQPFALQLNILHVPKHHDSSDTFDFRLSNEDSRLKELGWIEPYHPPKQLEGLKVRFFPAGAEPTSLKQHGKNKIHKKHSISKLEKKHKYTREESNHKEKSHKKKKSDPAVKSKKFEEKKHKK